MRTPPLLADFIHHRVCKPICEKLLTLPEQGLAFLESEISFKNMETTYVFRKYFKHARVLLKYSSDIFGENGQRGTSWYPESKAAGQISGGRLTGHGN